MKPKPGNNMVGCGNSENSSKYKIRKSNLNFDIKAGREMIRFN